jgi:peptidoglycan hydrolase CwlO-like protein
VRLPSEKQVVRASVVAVVALSVTLPSAMAAPARLPSVATGSALLLYAERALVIFGLLVALLVFLYRGWHGQLPRSVSERGAEWEDLAAADGGFQKQIDKLSASIDEIQQMLLELREPESTIAP